MSNDDDKKNVARQLARAAADRKQTEDLLAGFDRPGRTPKTPKVKRDFVDYHSNPKSHSNPDGNNNDVVVPPDPDPVVRGAKRIEPTFVISRDGKKFPTWFGWALALIAMCVAGGAVTYFALTSSAPTTTDVPTAPSAATTISSGSTKLAPTSTTRASDIPDPEPTPPSAVPSSTSSSTGVVPRPSAPTPSNSNDPRVDFMRTL